MGRRIGWEAMAGWLAMLGVSGCVAQEAPVPVCGRPDVLGRVDEMLHVQGRPVVLEAPPVGEVSVAAAVVPAAEPPVAHCAVRAHTVAFDTNRFGATPVHEPVIIRYTTELRHNGLFVRLD